MKTPCVLIYRSAADLYLYPLLIIIGIQWANRPPLQVLLMLHIPVSFAMLSKSTFKVDFNVQLVQETFKACPKRSFLLNGQEINKLHGKNTAILITIMTFSYCHFFHFWSKLSCSWHILNSNNFTRGEKKSK